MARNSYRIRHGQVKSRFKGKLVGPTTSDFSPAGLEQTGRDIVRLDLAPRSFYAALGFPTISPAPGFPWGSPNDISRGLPGFVVLMAHAGIGI